MLHIYCEYSFPCSCHKEGNKQWFLFLVVAFFSTFLIDLKLESFTRFSQILMQIYTENWVNSPGQEEDNSWQSFVFVPKDNWYIAKASFTFFKLICLET